MKSRHASKTALLAIALSALSLLLSATPQSQASTPVKKLSPLEAARNLKKSLNAAKTSQPPALRDKWALLVALDSFHDKALAPIKFAQNNALNLSTLLSNPDIGRFGPKRVLSVTNNKAIKTNIVKCLGEPWLLKHALPNDLVILYFGTRYIPTADGQDLRLCFYEADSGSPETGTISLKETLAELRRRIQSPYILTLLDISPADESPGAPVLDPAIFQTIADETHTSIFAASQPGTVSYPSSVANSSFFIASFLDGLKSGAGEMDLATVAQYVSQSVGAQVHNVLGKTQEPVLAVPRDAREILAIAPGAQVKSSHPERVRIGHPLDKMPEVKARLEAKERLRAQQAAARQAEADSTPEPEPEPEEDEDIADVDFGPYMAKMKRDIQARWSPPKGFNQKTVVAVFSITRDGKIVDPAIVDGSGDPRVDQSAMDALKAASPLDPLPKGSPPYVQIRYLFDWKVSKN